MRPRATRWRRSPCRRGSATTSTPTARRRIAYRTRMGFAVVSGDPIGDETRFAELVADFAAMCHTRGWRIVVLGCSERRLELWADAAVLGQSLRPVPIGRDVVIDVATLRHGRAQVPQPAAGRAAHPQLRRHHRGRCRAGPRRHAARRADRGAAGVAERGPHRARVLDVPRRRAGGPLPGRTADRRPRQARPGAGLPPVCDRRRRHRGHPRRAVAAPRRAQRYRRAAVAST